MKSNKHPNAQTSMLSCVILGTTAMVPAFGQQAGSEDRLESPFSAEISVGAEYDSNISVDELDTTTGADDFAAVIDLDLEFEKELSESTEISAGYSFSQSLHNEFTNFDIQTHFLSAGLSHDFSAFDAGASYRFIHTSLGGAGFLQMHQFEPYVTKFIGKKMFVRAAYTYTDKDFKNRVDRDTIANAGGADIYWFVDGVKTYFVTGYKYESQDAVDPQFDYQAHKVKVRFSQRIPFGNYNAKLKLGWRYETRDYSSITPSIGVIRADDRHRFQAEIEVPITEKVYTILEYEYADYTSNLLSADYTQSLVGVKLGMRF